MKRGDIVSFVGYRLKRVVRQVRYNSRGWQALIVDVWYDTEDLWKH